MMGESVPTLQASFTPSQNQRALNPTLLMQQPHYDMVANTFYEELSLDAFNSSSSLCPNHSAHQYYPQFLHNPRHKQRHEYQHSYQLFQQHPNQFHPSPQHQQQPQYLGALNCHQPQEESTTTVSKAFNTVLSDANGKNQEGNENFGELEAVYINARNKKKTDSALAVENTCNVANECQLLATKTTGVDGVRTKKGRKRRRKKQVEEEMGLMGSFFKRLAKRVIKHQEVLQNKLLEAIERMEKERAEWEEGWRVREREIHDREAIVKARERDLASKRDSSIVSNLEKITGQKSFVLVSSGKSSHEQLSTIHEY
ncbi:Trihelix transcription factor GT-2 [Glycine soja]